MELEFIVHGAMAGIAQRIPQFRYLTHGPRRRCLPFAHHSTPNPSRLCCCKLKKVPRFGGTGARSSHCCVLADVLPASVV